MVIEESNVKIQIDGNIYTLLKKDTDSEIKIYYDNKVINIATKEDVINNMPSTVYLDTVQAYYCNKGILVQMAIMEDLVTVQSTSITFGNTTDSELTQSLVQDEHCTVMKSTLIVSEDHIIEINSDNTNIVTNNDIKLSKFSATLRSTSIKDDRSYIDFRDNTDLILNSLVEQSLATGISLVCLRTSFERVVYDLSTNTDFILTNTEPVSYGIELVSDKTPLNNDGGGN